MHQSATVKSVELGNNPQPICPVEVGKGKERHNERISAIGCRAEATSLLSASPDRAKRDQLTQGNCTTQT